MNSPIGLCALIRPCYSRSASFWWRHMKKPAEGYTTGYLCKLGNSASVSPSDKGTDCAQCCGSKEEADYDRSKLQGRRDHCAYNEKRKQAGSNIHPTLLIRSLCVYDLFLHLHDVRVPLLGHTYDPVGGAWANILILAQMSWMSDWA